MKNNLFTIKDGVLKSCNDKTVESVVIPDTVTSISHGAFYGCDSLKKIIISNRDTVISYDSLYGCKSLESITLPDGDIIEISHF